MPEWLWRLATRPFAWILSVLPESQKYKLGISKRKKRMPYSLIDAGDVVFQIGAPSDLLQAGRSRAGYFAHLISGGGKLVVMEPDPINCQEFEAFAKRNGFSENVIVVAKGGWDKETTLGFFQSREHPASAVVTELNAATSMQMKRRGYTEIEVPVTTVDAVIKEYNLPVPKLISITTNGAEHSILNGMSETLITGPEYLALAIHDDVYEQEMAEINYEFVTDDDRGHTFRRKP